MVATSIGQVGGTVTYDETFSSSGETPVLLPDGVRAIDVDAVGGNGGSVSNIQGVTANGGRGAQVSGRISVTPQSLIWVEVGGNGAAGGIHAPGPGGFNGGGAARVGSTSPLEFYNPGAGGGGASDVRTEPRDDGLSPDPRLIIAAGGGGGGKPENGDSTTGGGHGGGGFSSGVSGAGGTGGIGGANPGAGATASAGGAGGPNGPTGGSPGESGELGQGGDGGAPPNNVPSGGGGGGGGGLYGGGGGRSGGGCCDFGGGGGGGGGSSLAGGSIQLAPAGSQPQVRLRYTIPNTGIVSGPGPVTTDTTPTFDFEASEVGSSFECRIDSNDDADFAPCPASHTLPPQTEATHTLDVRAVNAMGNFDPTPASSTFTVDTTPPGTTPPGTTGSGPTFAFGKLDRNTKKGNAHLTVIVPEPGEISYRGKGEARASGSRVRASRDVPAGRVRLKIKAGRFGKLAKKIRRKLKHGNGKAKVKVFVTYAPSGGTPETRAHKLRLIRKN